MANRPNYAAKMEVEKQNKFAAGLMSDRFPDVADIVVRMTYCQKGANSVLMVRTVNISPSSYAYFKMGCMIKGCSDGGFDLSAIIADMVKTHKKVKKGTLVCAGNVDNIAVDHASIEYEISIHYEKAKAAARA